ncbi:MAG TPA: hypothetical protein ENN46_04470 [Candidatus Woesearchaeota archaeon]|nr:hypothetical protein [Candidatus Woesearchaeota archaeon]
MNLESLLEKVKQKGSNGKKRSDLKNFLMNELLKNYQGEMDFLIRARKPSRALARFLNKIGEIKAVYKNIPYLAVKTDSKEGKNLISYFFQQKNSTITKEFRKEITQINNLDVASAFSIIDPLATKERSTSSLDEELWNLSMIGAYYAQRKNQGKGTKIGIIDTGVDYNHKELESNFSLNKGYDFIRENKEPFDFNGHGTHVAGTIAGDTTGVSPKATLLSLRVLDEYGYGSEFDVIRALDYAIENKINIVNMSLGSEYASDALDEICTKASRTLILVAAAGNNGEFLACYPAAFGEPVISVAAVDDKKEHAAFSNMHTTLDVSAPGVNIKSSIPGDRYAEYSGTSMATPHVTGSLSLLLSSGKGAEFAEDIMKGSCEPLDGKFEYDKEYVFGAGLVRADKLLARLKQKRGRK